MKLPILAIALVLYCISTASSFTLNDKLRERDFEVNGISFIKQPSPSMVIDILGNPIKTSVDSSSGYESVSAISKKMLIYKDVSFEFWKCNPTDTMETYNLVWIHLVGINRYTTRGIKLGNTVKKLLCAYGEPDKQASTPEQFIYFGLKRDACIGFTIKNNKVVAISMGVYLD